MVKKTDDINHPDHYMAGGIETIDIIKAKMSKDEYLGFLKGNVIKYVTRAGQKGILSDETKDLKKAQFYLNLLVKEKEG